jgi:hypothetical protein
LPIANLKAVTFSQELRSILFCNRENVNDCGSNENTFPSGTNLDNIVV